MLRRYANKSRVKVLTQIIIGMYLCPGSRAKIAEKATGGNKEKGKKSCQATRVPEALHLRYGNRMKAARKTVKVKET